jgi:hypothetical protein
MIHFELLRDQRILTITPEGPLQASDFQKLSEAVDPFIQTEGDLKGLLIDAPAFPGWHSFGDMVSHFKFVKNHERHIEKVAVVSDSGFISIMPHFVRHFIHAEIRHFDGSEKEQAMAWLSGQK